MIWYNQHRKAIKPGRPVRKASRARSTGTLIVVEDLCASGASMKPETERVYTADGHVSFSFVVNRWATVCEDHSEIVTHPTLALARSHSAVPEGWCEGCSGLEEE